MEVLCQNGEALEDELDTSGGGRPAVTYSFNEDYSHDNFVALHFSARHMSWLHCFCGIGATAGQWYYYFSPILISTY
ncbi:MAG: hypothetical protein GX913_06600 [Clostridiales bacterium]|nr:hypothetical protein [Clostridiales bacterium]